MMHNNILYDAYICYNSCLINMQHSYIHFNEYVRSEVVRTVYNKVQCTYFTASLEESGKVIFSIR